MGGAPATQELAGHKEKSWRRTAGRHNLSAIGVEATQHWEETRNGFPNRVEAPGIEAERGA